MLTLSDTLTSKKQPFSPLHDKKVLLYVCGITPYDYAHIGHGRCYVTFDTLYRLLTLLGYQVTYCRNFTDIDDKLLTRAQKEFNDPMRYPAIANRFIDAYHQDMQALNCISPTVEPRVTQTIDHIIEFIQGLIKTGHAYVVGPDVYYAVKSFPAYGKLSKQKIDELQSGARVQCNEQKQDPLDFALWKGEPEGTFWKSPWGYGRPGWHIECSSMAAQFLGKKIDIHGGGMDLIFPHHENEIAQSEGLFDDQFAALWMHNAFVRINKEKMSKSLGNFFTLRQIFEQYDPMVLRYYFLTHHYRAPIDFSFQDLDVAQKSYQRLAKLFASCAQEMSQQQVLAYPIVQKMVADLSDDLNSPALLGTLFEHIKELQGDADILCAVKQFLQSVLGLTLTPLPEKVVTITPEIEKLLADRQEARLAKNWALADQLRDQLAELGYMVQDKKS